MTKRTALVPGAIGITGRAIIEFLEKDGNWDIIGLSRRSNNFDSKAKFISVDLLNKEDSAKKIKELSSITHVFYCAYSPQKSVQDEIAPNISPSGNKNFLHFFLFTISNIFLCLGLFKKQTEIFSTFFFL